MEPFKNLLNAPLVRSAALQLQRHHPRFDAKRFVALATAGMDGLEMKARAMHICAALEATMPADFSTACAVFEAALAPVSADADAGADADPDAPGLRGWILWPVGEYIARHGQAQPERGLQALHALTQRFTAEFAIRPFIVQHPALVFDTLRRWCADPSAHVRRLVSEGSRPRLPWGLQLKQLITDPSPTLPLLQALQDDTSAYVRRSVANHLNDIAKDHPMLVAQWLDQHLPQASAERRALLRHASRTLVKRGDPRILAAWGVGDRFRGQVQLSVAPVQVRLGDSLTIELMLQSSAARGQTLVIDYVVHHVKADGSTSPKVFKGWSLTLPARAQITVRKQHAMKLITTRRYHPGLHALGVQINGRVVAEAAFDLALA